MKKIAMILGAALLSSLTVACGGNDCEDAADRMVSRYEECGGKISNEDGGDGNGESAECSESAGKKAQCLADCQEAAECIVVVPDPTAEGYADAASDYSDCITKC